MKYRQTLTERLLNGSYWFCFEGEGEGGEGGEGGGGGGGGGDIPARPESVPEKFWDTITGTARVEEMAKAYTDISTAYTRKNEDLKAEMDAERFKNRPESADKYEFKMPDGIEVPPGFKIELDENNPILGFWREHSFNNGYDQSAFEGGVAEFIKWQMSELPNAQEEITALGEQGQARWDRARSWVSSALSEEEFGKLGSLVATADGIAAIEKLMDKAGVPFNQGDGGIQQSNPEDDPANQPAFDQKTQRLQSEAMEEQDPIRKQELTRIYRERFQKAYPGRTEPQRNAR